MKNIFYIKLIDINKSKNHILPGYYSYSGAILIISSILRIEIAASVANLLKLNIPQLFDFSF